MGWKVSASPAWKEGKGHENAAPTAGGEEEKKGGSQLVTMDGENSNGKHFAEKRQKKTSAKNTRFARWRMRETCQKAREGREGETLFTECEANVEFSFAGQFE